MYLPFIHLIFSILLNSSASLKVEKHPPQPVGSQPDFRQSLSKFDPKLRQEWRLKRKTEFGKGRAGEPICPNNVLCDYARGHEGTSKILSTCGDVVLVSPMGTIKDNPTFIKFMAIPKEHVPSAWSITDTKFIPKAHQCIKQYLSSPGATANLQKLVFAQCKGDKDCQTQHKKLSDAVTALHRPLKFDDFVTYFHIPPGINHLHMHIALSAKKFRAFSDAYEDHRCMSADAVQTELLKAGPPPAGGAKGGSAVPGRLAAGLGAGLKQLGGGGMQSPPGSKMGPAMVSRRSWDNNGWGEELERRWEDEWFADPYIEARSADSYNNLYPLTTTV